ncbi:MAG TPA: type II toxin-antitoxin system VapC family toxin [Thermoanaerobaculia bacterium]|nr:type II toxin-antitoxin system VapC family toxin [Thermoanaerobaculia bacterium]
MRLLVDTHCWLWMLVEPERFSAASHEILESADNELFLSAASSWEISVKYSLGELVLPDPPAEYVPDLMLRSGVRGLPIEHRHALAVASLPLHHRDPFDRLLVAQAMVESLPIMTADPQLSLYAIELIEP